MESLYLLVPLSVGIVFLVALIFWWSVRNGQYDDMEGPAHRILMDDQSQRRRDLAAQEQRHVERAARASNTKDTGND